MRRLLEAEDGQALAEYGVLGVLIFVVSIALITGVGTKTSAFFQGLVNLLP